MTKAQMLLLDYARQLRRHTEGRRAVHIKLPALERHYHETHYKQSLGACLRPLSNKFEGEYFALPNGDAILITKGASIDDIDPSLNNARHLFKDSRIINSLDPIQGVSDAFTSWFDLETDYDNFMIRVEALTSDKEDPSILAEQAAAKPKGKAEKPSPQSDAGPAPLKMNRRVRVVPVVAPSHEVDEKILNPETLLQLYGAIKNADFEGILRRQTVMAIQGRQKPRPIMTHRYIAFDDVVNRLMPELEVKPDRWLKGYLFDLVDERIFASKPDISSQGAMLSSLRISTSTVMKKVFDNFDASLGTISRSNIILELDMVDALQSPDILKKVLQKIKTKGYGVCLSGLDPRSFLWMDTANIDVQFVKLKNPKNADAVWNSDEYTSALKQAISQMEAARVILSNCDSQDHIQSAIKCGIFLFQGEAISPSSL